MFGRDRYGTRVPNERKTMTYWHLTAGDCWRENSDAAWLCFEEIATEPGSPTKRELKIIELVAQGLKNSEVAEAIGMTEHVVKNHLKVIYDKLGIWNRVELALWYEARRHREETMN
jgi:DNA-binding NarL/FixJ family response regulator